MTYVPRILRPRRVTMLEPLGGWRGPNLTPEEAAQADSEAHWVPVEVMRRLLTPGPFEDLDQPRP